ncbi:MAG: ankyrin repeat domain-containing protein [Chitinophagaceae bacterium]|nr:ankyrin repeat domain-containing protein [Chitinophagaceae bacterium]
MQAAEITGYISRGRTDLFVELLKLPGWQDILHEGQIKPLQWLVYYNDVTALRLLLDKGGNLDSINLDDELGNAAYFGHWKVCDFLISQGANVNARVPDTGETPLHSALSKAGRPYYIYTVRLLLENGAGVNAKTIPGISTGAFMRDVRTKGETPLHRAAAYADEAAIRLLLEHGAAKDEKDAHGNSPLSWASEHLRPGSVLALLSYGPHSVSEAHINKNKSDHGQGWGSGMDWNLFGDYLPDKKQT